MTPEEEQELREQAETGRKAKIAADFMEAYILMRRTQTIEMLETKDFQNSESVNAVVSWLRILKDFEIWCRMCTDMGEIAEKELNEDGR